MEEKEVIVCSQLLVTNNFFSIWIFSQLFMVTLIYYQFMIKKWVIMTFSIDLPCSPHVRQQYQSSQSLYSVVTSYEFYDDFGTHFSMIFDEKSRTNVVAELTIRNVRVICSLVFMQLYRFPTRQTDWKIPYTALSTKLMQAKYVKKSFYLKKSHEILCTLCQGLPTKTFTVTF